jgi:NADPH:quinone reductase
MSGPSRWSALVVGAGGRRRWSALVVGAGRLRQDEGMRALLVTANGGPEVLDVREVPAPEPGPGQALVEVAAAGVNFIDVYLRTGVYPSQPPFVPGVEAAGRVVAVGEGVTGFAPGERVGWASAPGAHAQLAAVPVATLVRLPAEVSDSDAAAVLLQGMTAHYLTTSTYPVREGDWALVHAAAGGMGLLLTQLVTRRGGRVVGTVSTAEKEKLARDNGAEQVIRYTEVADLAAAVREVTGGAGVAVAYDGVGAATFDASLGSLRRRGMLALYGAASGPVPPVDLQRLNAAGSVFVTRPTLAHHTEDPAELAWRAREVLGWVADGSLSVHIDRAYPLAEAAQAYRALESRQTTGKLLLIP